MTERSAPNDAPAAERRSAFAEVRTDLGVSARALSDSFRNPDLARAQLALAAFSICEWASFIALVVFAFDDGGAPMVGLISLLQQIPAALVAPIGSVLGDRFRRERVYLLAEVGMAAACSLASVAALKGSAATLVYAAALTVGWVLTLVRPTHGALLPWIARDPTELTSAYTAAGVIESVSVLVGPMLAAASFAAAAALEVSGPGLVYAFLAGLLVVGSLLIARVRSSSGHDRAEGRFAPLREVREGFRYVRSDPRVRLLVGLLGLGTFVLGFIDTLIVILALEVLGGGETTVGLLNGAFGVGAIVGASIALVAGSRERLFPAFRLGTALYGLPLVVTALVPGLGAPLLGASGTGAMLFDVSGRTMLQRLIPDVKLTRVLGVLESSYMASEGIGAFLAALLVTWLGPEWTLVIGGVLLPLAGFAARGRLRAVDVGPRVPVDDLRLLGSTAILHPLPPPTLERIARNAVAMVVPAGTVVIREGDRGDRFYAVASGELEVTSGGRPVARHGPGSYVGEIALLRDVPRTATVTALCEARLLALERDEFLRAVTGHEMAHAAADSVAEGRLEELRAADPGTPPADAPGTPDAG